MWTGKPRLPSISFAAILALGLTACVSRPLPGPAPDGGASPDVAWWYDHEFTPLGVEVRGIPIREFDRGWRAVMALGEDGLANRISANRLADYQRSGVSFMVAQDLDLDGADEEVFVGTYETRDGTRGRFLAVSSEGRLRQHFAQSGTAGFSALLPVGDSVRWYKCLECGEYELLRWTGESYVLE